MLGIPVVDEAPITVMQWPASSVLRRSERAKLTLIVDSLAHMSRELGGGA